MTTQLIQKYNCDLLTDVIDASVSEISIHPNCAASLFFENQEICEKILLAHMRFDLPLKIIAEFSPAQIDLSIEKLFKELQFYTVSLSLQKDATISFDDYLRVFVAILGHWLVSVETTVEFTPGAILLQNIIQESNGIPLSYSEYFEQFQSKFTAEEFENLIQATKATIDTVYAPIGGLQVVTTSVVVATTYPLKKFYEVAGKSVSALVE